MTHSENTQKPDPCSGEGRSPGPHSPHDPAPEELDSGLRRSTDAPQSEGRDTGPRHSRESEEPMAVTRNNPASLQPPEDKRDPRFREDDEDGRDMLPPFPNPVPVKPRHDGWTPARQRIFLEALARCGNVSEAARCAGMARESAYRLRRRAGAEAFARTWDAAMILARDLYAEELLDKARTGWTEQVWYHGELVGERTRFHPGLLLAALARLDKAADGVDLDGNPARAAAGQFEAMIECIGEDRDPAILLAQQDAAADPRPMGGTPGGIVGDIDMIDDEALLAQLEEREAVKAIEAMDPADVDISDLDLDEREEWDDADWARAIHSGWLDRIGFWDSYADEHGDGECDGDERGEEGGKEGGETDGPDGPDEHATEARVFSFKRA